LNTTAQTVNIDPQVIAAGTSLQIGIGLGGDTILDATDSIFRSDTAVYTQAVHGSDALLATKAGLLAHLESVLTYSGANSFSVNLGEKVGDVAVKDTLVGVERIRFETRDGMLDVALVGNTNGVNGYHSLAAAANDNQTAQAVVISNDAMKSLDHASVISMIDGMFSTVGGHLALNLTPGSGSATTFLGTSKVIFETNDANNPVTVFVVGADGYTSLDAAMDVAQAGDVIYLAGDITAEGNKFTVYKEDMVFMANASTNNNALTLQLGYIETADHSLEIHNLTLLGNANITVQGNLLDNVIIGNRGNNIIYGSDGNDVIDTGGGTDRVYGGNGNDTLIAQRGNTTGSTLLSGGGGDDTLVNATTDGASVVMTGGTGADTFAVASLSSDNGNLNINGVITDLSARNGDMLDFSHLLNSAGKAATAADVAKAANYAMGDMNYNFTPLLDMGAASTKAIANDLLTNTTVDLLGTLKVSMTTTSNVSDASVYATNGAHGIAQDVYSQASVASELSTLLPLLEHNPLG